MNIKNIKIIMKSSLWKKMIKNKNYLDYKIVDTSKKGYWNMLVVFFDMDIRENTMKKYLKEGKRMAERESLDDNPILKTYGRVRIIVFS